MPEKNRSTKVVKFAASDQVIDSVDSAQDIESEPIHDGQNFTTALKLDQE